MFQPTRRNRPVNKNFKRTVAQGAIFATAIATFATVATISYQSSGEVEPVVLASADFNGEADETLLDVVRGGTTAVVSRRSAERAPDVVDLHSPKQVELNLRGKITVEQTLAGTVRELLLSHDVVLGPNDYVSVSLDAEITDDMQISVLTGEVQHLVEEQVQAHASQEQSDSNLDKGTTRVIQEGRDGLQQVSYRVVVSGDTELSRHQTATVTVQQPVTEIIAVGTREQASAPTGGGGDSGGGSTGGGDTGGGNTGGGADGLNWPALAQCESGGNPSIVSSNGLYHGLYQFSVPTWQSVGGTGLPSQASPEEQLKRAKMLYNRSGAGQWPHCGPRLFS